MRTERKVQLPPRERRATFAPDSVNEAERTVEVVWTASAEVERWPLFGEAFLEVMPIEAARLETLNRAAPLIDSHRHDTVRAILGHVVRAWTEGPLGRAVVKFSDRPDADAVFRDVIAGHVRAVSFGARVDRFRREPPAEKGGLPRMVATSWTPVELSLCPVGADPGATVRHAPPTHECVIEEKKMAESTPTPSEPTEVERSAAVDVEHAAEVERQDQIRTATDAAARIRPSLAPVLRAIGDLALSEGLPADRVRHALMTRIADEQDKVPTRTANPSITPMHDWDSPQSLIGRMGSALAARASGAEPTDDAREFRHRSLVDLGRELLAARHVSGAQTMAPNQVMRGMHTTSDFPLLLADAAGKMMRPAYEAAPPGLRAVAKTVEAPDYKDVKRLALGELSLLKVNEAAEVKYGTTQEQQETNRVHDFARIIALSNHAIQNDDMQAFSQLVQRFGWAAAEKEREELVALLAGSGPTMSDGVALFHATNPTAAPHANLGSGVISVTSIGAAVAAMRKQKGLSGIPINVQPRFLVVPAALEMVARQFLATITAAQSSNVNPWVGMLELVVDPRLDALSATKWYVFADPNQIGTLEIAFLTGQTGPQIETRPGWNTLGAEIRALHSFGVGAVDWRGAFSSTGV